MCPILNGFHDIDISLYTSKIVDNKYYILFLIPVFIVEVTMLVQFTYYKTFLKNSFNINDLYNSCEDMVWSWSVR
jgi:hypothetical protein